MKLRLYPRYWRIWKDEQGQDLIEYSMIAAFVTIAAAAVVPGLATPIAAAFSKIESALSAAGS